MKKLPLIFALLATFAFAHDAWIQKDSNTNAIIYWGHLDKELKTLDIAKIQNIDGFDANLHKTKLNAINKDGNTTVIIDKNILMTLMELKPSYKVVTPNGTKYGVGKRDANDTVISSYKGIKYSKALFSWSEKFNKPIGAPLEIVILKNPFKAKIGEFIDIQTFANLKPVANLKLIVDGNHDENKTIKTDENGIAKIAIDKKGLKLIATSKESPLENDPDATKLIESANISFVIK